MKAFFSKCWSILRKIFRDVEYKDDEEWWDWRR